MREETKNLITLNSLSEKLNNVPTNETMSNMENGIHERITYMEKDFQTQTNENMCKIIEIINEIKVTHAVIVEKLCYIIDAIKTNRSVLDTHTRQLDSIRYGNIIYEEFV